MTITHERNEINLGVDFGSPPVVSLDTHEALTICLGINKVTIAYINKGWAVLANQNVTLTRVPTDSSSLVDPLLQ